jgi:DNA-binding response OmpR family regulator
MRILVCEDQDAIRHMIQTLVQASGHEVVGVAMGAQAVELALHEHFDILLLDLMLPGTLDGFGVCERLRAHESTRELPIFVISALDDPASRKRAVNAGATAFYSKPFRPLELLEEINRRARASRPPVA